MLKLIITCMVMPLMLMLPVPHMWAIMSLTLMMLTFMCLTMFIPSISMVNQMIYSLLFNDLMSSMLIMLTLWTTAMMLTASYKIMFNNQSKTSFVINVLMLNMVLVITFMANNFLMFYIFFEASLIPTLILILGWGYQPERLQAGSYLMLYTMTASLPLLMSLMYIYKLNNTLSIFNIMSSPSMNILHLWWLMSIMAFLVKMPLYMFHLWLPKAHVEAPVAGSMVLAGVLLKLGSYGLLRLSVPFSWLNTTVTAMITSLSLWGAVLTAMMCLRQTDLKSLIAYSSIGHMGLLTAGTLSCTQWGWEGSLAMMLAHGLCSSAMFSITNMTYEVSHTRSIFLNKGFLSIFPAMSFWWFILSACNMGAPPSFNLFSEIILLTSVLSISYFTAPVIAMMSFYTAAYSLVLYTSTQHGWRPSFSNPMNLLTQRNYLIILLHASPLILMMIKAEMFSSWV
uniref:NADH dehydrogenase subunit 4 n=1 Tax=Asychis amphiglyptus TaxID=1931186 RepID=UPI0022DCE149|nr:NADH dehydrogenase subunit 4 [Asychis amphiglyptus]UZZ45811.1 NADH dehydrogenase subunit 4 [Asychis amphiglyptus]